MTKGKIQLTRKLNKVGSSLMVAMPSQLVTMLGWEKGEEVNIKLNEKGELILFK